MDWQSVLQGVLIILWLASVAVKLVTYIRLRRWQTILAERDAAPD